MILRKYGARKDAMNRTHEKKWRKIVAIGTSSCEENGPLRGLRGAKKLANAREGSQGTRPKGKKGK